jgi:hypothetical protein
MEGYRLQSYQAGAAVKEGSEEESMEVGSAARRKGRTAPEDHAHTCGQACGDKPWVRRGCKWLLVGACVALVALVLFALINSLATADEPAAVPTWARWEVVCVGTGGGLDQSDLPGFLLRPLPVSTSGGMPPPPTSTAHGAPFPLTLTKSLRCTCRWTRGRRSSASVGRFSPTSTLPVAQHIPQPALGSPLWAPSTVTAYECVHVAVHTTSLLNLTRHPCRRI